VRIERLWRLRQPLFGGLRNMKVEQAPPHMCRDRERHYLQDT
jgi:hypothetical protein